MIFLKQKWIVRGLAAAAGALVLLGFGARWIAIATGHDVLLGILRLADLDAEGNLPTFFSSSILLIAAALLAVITALKWKVPNTDAPRWTVLTLGFVWMATDEAAAIHELLVEPMRRILGGQQLGVFYYAWVVPALAVVVALGFYFMGFLRRLPVKTRRRFLVAGGIYLSGAIGFEMLGGRYSSSHSEVHDFTYALLSTMEESLEMTGVIVFIRALLIYIADTYQDVHVRIE